MLQQIECPVIIICVHSLLGQVIINSVVRTQIVEKISVCPHVLVHTQKNIKILTCWIHKLLILSNCKDKAMNTHSFLRQMQKNNGKLTLKIATCFPTIFHLIFLVNPRISDKDNQGLPSEDFNCIN